MEENKSHRHHYIPVWFQKLFSKEGFWVYDKQKDSIIKNKRYPDSLFYENDRNTITYNGKEDDILERSLFTPIDMKFSNLIKNVLLHKVKIDRYAIEEILVVINSLRLRNPIYDERIQNIFSKYSFGDLGFSITDKQNNRKIESNEFIGTNDELFIKSQAVMAMMSPFLKNRDKFDQIINSTRVVFDTYPYSLLSDNPIVFRHSGGEITDLNDFYFSLDNITHVINMQSVYDKNVRSIDFRIKDILQMRFSRRYSVSKDKDYLKKTILCYKNEKMKDDDLLMSLFETIR
jgi:hypothetical protein